MNGTLLLPYFWLVAGLAALIVSGNYLVTGGVALARYFKISALIVGLTIVAFATSAPELFVSIGAAIKGAPDIALGNVVGSNIANIALVIGLTALIFPIPLLNNSVGFDLIVMLAATILLFVFGYNGLIGRIEGLCLVVVLSSYIVWSITKEKRKKMNEKSELINKEISEDASQIETSAPMKPLLSVLMITLSIIGLYFGSEWFVNGARGIALQWGVSERVIGISIVAIGTSMPELVTSVIAALKKEMDISIGNIIGSNIFNIASVLGITSLIHPLRVASRPLFVNDMIWVFGIAIALLLAMIPLSKGKITRWKGGVLLVLYAVYIFTLYG